MAINKPYRKRSVGDIVNGAELVESIDGKRWKMRCSCGNIFTGQPSETSGRCRECGHMRSEKGNASKNAVAWDFEISRICREAAEHGMTYGKYVQMISMKGES